jgi:hypothetical protein
MDEQSSEQAGIPVTGETPATLSSSNSMAPGYDEDSSTTDMLFEPDKLSEASAPAPIRRNHRTVSGGELNNQADLEVLLAFVRMAGWLMMVMGAYASMFCMFFSILGYGGSVFAKLVQYGEQPWEVSRLVLLGCLAVMYFFDVTYWRKCLTAWKYILVFIAISACSVCMLTQAHIKPELPLMWFFAAAPVVAWRAKPLFFAAATVDSYLLANTLACAAVGFVVGLGWSVSTMSTENSWNGDFRETWGPTLQCAPPYHCVVLALLWSSPMLLAGFLFLFALVCYLLAKSFSKSASECAHIKLVFKMFGGSLLLLFSCIWVAFSVGGTIGTTLMNFASLAFITLAGTFVSVFGRHSIEDTLYTIPLVKKLSAYFASDWTKAILLLTTTPFLLVYGCMSIIHQKIRVHVIGYKGYMAMDGVNRAEERKATFTQRARHQLKNLSKFQWTSVLAKMVTCGLVYIVLIVFEKATSIALAALETALAGSSPTVVTLIFIAVSLFMFLLPPVPGPMMYLVGGLMLTQNYWQKGEGPLGFGASCAVGSLVCLLIKLMACTIQQKCIGERMSNNTWVKSTVGVNSIPIRAIERILSTPGLSLPKVAILCEGPDWPTSVLTGILKLSLPQMLLGTAPAYFVTIVPFYLSGAFKLRKAESPAWASIDAGIMAFTALIMLVGMFTAIHFIEEVAAHHHAELTPPLKPLDKSVETATTKEKERQRKFNKVMAWNVLPKSAKLILVSAVSLMFVSFNLVAWTDLCFNDFEPGSDIDLPIESGGLDGDVLNAFKPLGYVVLKMVLASYVLMWLFKRYGSTVMMKKEKDGGGDGDGNGIVDNDADSDSAPLGLVLRDSMRESRV